MQRNGPLLCSLGGNISWYKLSEGLFGNEHQAVKCEYEYVYIQQFCTFAQVHTVGRNGPSWASAHLLFGVPRLQEPACSFTGAISQDYFIQLVNLRNRLLSSRSRAGIFSACCVSGGFSKLSALQAHKPTVCITYTWSILCQPFDIW